MDQATEGNLEVIHNDGQSTVNLLAVNPVSAYYIMGNVNGVSVHFMLDTGAAVSLMQKAVWDNASGGRELAPWTGPQLVGVEGTPLVVHGVAKIDVALVGKLLPVEVAVVGSLRVQAILGLDFLENNSCVVNAARKTLHLQGLGIPIQCSSRTSVISQSSVALRETLHIPAFSEIETMADTHERLSGGVWLLEGLRDRDLPVLVAGAVVAPVMGGENTCVPVRLVNPTSVEVKIHKGTKIAMIEQLDVSAVLAVTDETPPRQESPMVAKEKQEMLWALVEQCGESLSEAEKRQAYHLFLAYADVFASSDDDLGRTGMLKHSIDTADNHPIRQPARRVPPFRREEVHKLLKDMLERDVIQPSSSPWASPVVLVQKKDGTLRFCVDYRKLNAITRKDAYPIPRIDDTLDTLAGSCWFSTLDLLSGYWQVEVAEEDRPKTAFCTKEGLFEFKVMPFGLCNAPATFQRLMDLVLAGVQWSTCLVYLDDIIVVGRTFEEHLCNVRGVLDKLKQAGLRLKPKKCAFFQKEVRYLGHVVSEGGVATDLSKTEEVATWPEPTSLSEVQEFLGLANYYRRFIQNFAQIAKPLHQLSEKSREFQWTEKCAEAFRELKQHLTSAPVLAFPDYSQPFVLDTDASGVGIGAVLSQVQKGEERVIAYASRTLTKPERRYCVTRRELLAVVVYTQHFRHYLLGRPFMLRTDHGSLTWLQSFKEPEGQLARWLEQLQEFDFQIMHRRGRSHGNADALSRRPCEQCGLSHGVISEATSETLCMVVEDPEQQPVVPTHDLRQLQLEDDNVGPVLKAREANRKPGPADLAGKSRELARLVQLWDQLLVRDGTLYRQYEDEQGSGCHLQLVAPKPKREEILRDLHSGAWGGHLGEKKMLSRLRERFYWPGYTDDVQLWCRNCPECAARKTSAPRRRAPLQSMRSGYPMQIVATDIVGPFPKTDSGNVYVLVAADCFTRWVEAYAIPNQEAVTVATKLVDEMFCRFSVPEQLHSDQGRQFESAVMQEVSRILQIRKSRTTPYHPQSDGLVERFNRTLLDMLATTVRKYPKEWETHLQKLCMAYNTSVHSSTGFTPFYLMFGRQAKLPIDVAYGNPTPESDSVSQYAATMKDSLEQAYRRVREQSGKSAKRQKELYDQKVHGKACEVGDLVWLHSPAVPRGQSRKLHCPWVGPFEVVKRLSDVVYRIRDTRPRRRRTRVVVHFDRLKPCSPGLRTEDICDRQTNQHSTPSLQREGSRPRPGVHLNVDSGDSSDEDDSQSESELPPTSGPRVVPPLIPPPRVAAEPRHLEVPLADNPIVRRYPSRRRQPPDRLVM